MFKTYLSKRLIMDNNSNWENASATNLTFNRPNSSTYLWSKLYCSNNIYKQLTNILSCITNTLTTNQNSSPNTDSRRTQAHIPNTFSSTKSNKLNNFLFQCCFYFHANPIQFNIDITKINFIMTYLTGVVQED